MSTSAITIVQLRRAEQLARVGLSDRAVACVLNLDEGLDLNRHQIRYYRRKYTDVRSPRGAPYGQAS